MYALKVSLAGIQDFGRCSNLAGFPLGGADCNICASLQQEDVSVQLEALDILGDLLSRFGGESASVGCAIDQHAAKFRRKTSSFCLAATTSLSRIDDGSSRGRVSFQSCSH